MRDTGKNPRVLIVEDDADINRLLYKILKKNGYAPEQAFSGTEARLLLQAGVYDLLLLDLMLPGMTGEELLDYIRRERRLSVPVMILSAKGSLHDRVELLMDGADDYLTKPFKPEEVLVRICAVLRRCGREAPNTVPEKTIRSMFHVSNIRKKLAKVDPDEEYIQTVWGIGFKMKCGV